GRGGGGAVDRTGRVVHGGRTTRHLDGLGTVDDPHGRRPLGGVRGRRRGGGGGEHRTGPHLLDLAARLVDLAAQRLDGVGQGPNPVGQYPVRVARGRRDVLARPQPDPLHL